jgi:predicted RNase H-like HicB family nuclease
MTIRNDVKVVLTQSSLKSYQAYIEQMPEIKASGQSYAEANQNLMQKIKRLESEIYSTFNITEYKYENGAFMK